MKRKIIIYVLSILCVFMIGCDSTGTKENNEVSNEKDEFQNTEFVKNEGELTYALTNDYSITITDNITSDNPLIIEGEFFKTDTTEENNVVKVGRKLNLFSKDEDNNIIKIEYNGNGFLLNMVRILSGTLIKVAKGEIDIIDIKNLLEAKSRSDIAEKAPAKGLCMKEVHY